MALLASSPTDIEIHHSNFRAIFWNPQTCENIVDRFLIEEL